ncbi:type II toxin-antitoxin system prevent-host-death family antitoxin [Ethanoligenens harbinense]|uniref:Antitoxin n=1 Tax=Ethanoligenens harbinense (strain DSM 18485 / JCM 12961 / CGMCC 1.5033 / YUAN-3) TaxID=663278 RepID=E6U6C8_ETHHY|nr:type II toxin-antitoxin system prevent-host-death family antitoxin [Ethanoligenens harbinense]ADU26895.1 prevent-host-death family protein [Ethanoligenens harbinense YUAN-3]AVQ95992.1 type II toxin-antitoxin system Phd/YefM family antitoxin [Ethanoligenens harbinense YUAN-3]AYF38654.1 type II toxin-antitoxin system Phd/YefM family antitoxin [Ethanoligenens harbinense]AYF41401.1 type II toxin-antitoxin system Phd/YefM family antitoxin [Ethanoligenens harbinense]QCN92234.1 type II toxin-antit
MPRIQPSSDLRNKYNEISAFCHEYDEPVYITKNGQGDLAVMSIETYEKLVGKFELYHLLDEGMDAAKQGRTIPASEAFDRVFQKLDERP